MIAGQSYYKQFRTLHTVALTGHTGKLLIVPATIYKRELKAILKVPLGSLLSTSYPIDR